MIYTHAYKNIENDKLRKQVVVSIVNCAEGDIVVLVKIDGGKEVKKRLSDMGFIPKAEIKILKKSKVGPLVLEVRGARIAIGRGEAAKIFVEKEDINAKV